MLLSNVIDELNAVRKHLSVVAGGTPSALSSGAPPEQSELRSR